MRPPELTRVHAAWAIAIAVDAIQAGAFTFLGPFGYFVDNGLDVLVMIVFWRLFGWHWVFLPTFLLELVPFVDVAPTWTLAVWVVTRQHLVNPGPERELENPGLPRPITIEGEKVDTPKART